MRISATGTSNRGFTILELIVVLLIIAAAAAMVLPRLSAFQDLETRNSARNIAELMGHLNERAVAGRTGYRLLIDLNSQKISVQQLTESGDTKIPDDPFLQRNPVTGSTRISDLTTERRGKVESGSVTLPYGIGGLSEPVVLRLGRPGGRQYTVQALPVNGSVKVAEGSLEMIR